MDKIKIIFTDSTELVDFNGQFDLNIKDNDIISLDDTIFISGGMNYGILDAINLFNELYIGSVSYERLGNKR